jgi:acyl-CoA synthetase
MPNRLLTLLSAEAIARHTASGWWRGDTSYALAAGHAQRAPESLAARDRCRRLTYRELVAAADALAADLARRGLREGDRVAVWLPSRIECAVALLACSRNGYVLCPSLHRDHTVGEIVGLLRRIRAAALIVQPGFGADADRHDGVVAAGAVPSLRHIYRLEPLAAGAGPPFAGLSGGRDSEPKRDPNQVVYLAFTSGTTAEPKGVMHSDNTLLASARAIAADWHIDPMSVVYSLSPLSHNLGFGAMVMSLFAGAELVVHDQPRGASLVDRILETGTSFLVGVPAHANDLLAEMRARNIRRLGRLKGFRISGAAASRDVVAGLIAHGMMPQSGYGMTETCSHQYTLPNDDPARVIETSGRAFPGYEVRIFRTDDPDTEVPHGEIGQIGGRGASLMLGYFDDQAATEDSFNRDGWFMTGDLGSLDDDGYLRITGRLKDVIIRGGHNIHPARIEALAMRHRAVARVAAIPIPDDRLGEKVCLAVMFRDGERAEPGELLGHLSAAGLSRYDMPEYLLPLDEIPLTPNGKIRKRELVEWVAAGRVTPQPVRWTEREPRR